MIKMAIVTGVSRGLGAAMSGALLGLGFEVIGLGRTSNAELSHHLCFQFLQCDLSRSNELRDFENMLVDLASKKPQQIVLINNAATAEPAGVLGGLSLNSIEQSLQLNLVSVVQLSNVFCRCLANVKTDKRIINISSGAAFTAIEGSGIYCIAKAGMEMLTKSIAAETSHHGVSAMSIQPGVIDTPMQDWLRQQSEQRLPSVKMYQNFQDQQQLLPAMTVAENVVKSAIIAPARNGQSFSHDKYI